MKWIRFIRLAISAPTAGSSALRNFCRLEIKRGVKGFRGVKMKRASDDKVTLPASCWTQLPPNFSIWTFMHGYIFGRRIHRVQKILDSQCVMSPINFLLDCLKSEKWDFWVLLRRIFRLKRSSSSNAWSWLLAPLSEIHFNHALVSFGGLI